MKAAADGYIKDSVASGTLKGYKKGWIKWLDFARRFGYRLAPPPHGEVPGVRSVVQGVGCGVGLSVGLSGLALCRGWLQIPI
jgi:hypothetical protein